MMTRDHWLWRWPFVAAGVLSFLVANFELLHQVFPGMTEQHEAWIRLAAMASVAFVAKMGMSPLGISTEGKIDAARKTANVAGSAQRAVVKAAVEMDKAAVATTKAADAAVEAKKEVEKVP